MPKQWEIELKRRHAQARYRTRLVFTSAPSVRPRLGAQSLLAFCSNDYLGLANHPAVVAAFKTAADQFGVGAGASHLISGHTAAHHALEEELADFVGAERALLFSTGYMANLGVVTALCTRRTLILEDRSNHASLIDAARLARTRVIRYRHIDLARLTAVLSDQDQPRDVLITTDAVFSMDGDLAPLPELMALADPPNARLLVDDAHGFGVLGVDGRGSFAHHGISVKPPAILMATLGKALGTFGAFVAGEEALIETLIQRARTYIYTTALPPAVAAATRASLKLVRAESWRRQRLRELVAYFRAGAAGLGFNLGASATPIQPLLIGTSAHALRASQQLRDAGILVPAIRPPTVPEGTARLRITFSAEHEQSDVDRLLDALSHLPRGGYTGIAI